MDIVLKIIIQINVQLNQMRNFINQLLWSKTCCILIVPQFILKPLFKHM